MIKNGLKSYFKSLKFFFTPFGTLALGVIIGLSVAIPAIFAAIDGLVENVTAIVNNANLDFNAFKDSFVAAIRTLDWNDPVAALQSILNREWLLSTFTDCIKSLVENYEPLVEQATQAMNLCVGTIIGGIFIVLFFAIVGIIAGYFITKSLVRHTIAKRAFWKFFLATAIDALLVTAYAALTSYLTTLWEGSLYLFTLLSPLLIGIGGLIEAYLLHGWKKVRAKEIINVKNSLKLMLVNVLIILISCVFTLIVAALLNNFTAIFVALALFEISAIVIGMNAEAYVKDAVEQAAA